MPMRRHGVHRGLGAIAAAVAGTVLAVLPAAASPGPAGTPVRVVVAAAHGGVGAASDAVRAAGGTVERTYDTVGELLASIPASALPRLRGSGAVAGVTPDVAVHLLGAQYDAATDPGSMPKTAQAIGATAYHDAGYFGQGVDVAVVESGVVPVEGLTGGRILLGPDLSSESTVPTLRNLDTFGHGTHVAGIIAGRDDGAARPYADASRFSGIAPEARIVSVKVADAHGDSSLSQVIAAISWVTHHRRDAGLNIRVLNLSLSVDSPLPWAYDPLAYAAEQAWRAGVVVVAAAGNDGPTAGLADPAYDPNLLAVGAADTQGTVDASDDTVASFSSGAGRSGPDLVAPGVHIVSLRDPGSYIDRTYSATGLVGSRFFRGSGTSQAAAVVSGAAALLLSQHPELTPDGVKGLLMATALRLHGTPAPRQGQGEVDLARALTAPVPEPFDHGPAAYGRGSGQWSQLTWTGGSWSGGSWTGGSWSGGSWSGGSWSGGSWSGGSWSGGSWSGGSWSGGSWSGGSWSGGSWSGDLWGASSWT